MEQRFDSLGNLYVESVYYNTDTPEFGNGYDKFYYRSGMVQGIQYKKNGMDDSVFYYYYENGALFEKFFYSKNERVGGQYLYDSETHKVYRYDFIIEGGERSKFHYNYDPYTKEYKFKGVPIFNLLNFFNGRDVNLSDTVSVDLLIAIPENLKAVFTFRIFKNGKWSKNAVVKPEYFRKLNIHYLTYDIFCENGKAIFVTSLSLYDTSLNKLVYKYNDTTRFNRKK